MLTITSASELHAISQQYRESGKTIGFVPTMGALHEGHLKLVHQSVKETDITIVSIFVNPNQFNDKDDLKRYPRTPEQDLNLLQPTGCHVVFMPAIEEIYPTPDTRNFDFGLLESVMEGAHRPGHFNGVAQVVSRLFEIVTPHKAFFGLKDFQQLAIICEMVSRLHLPITIVPCNIVREADGLAMSSRNTLLNPQQRKAAPHIYSVLKQASAAYSKQTPAQLSTYITQQINKNQELEVEYAELVDAKTLQTVTEWDEAQHIQLCVAVKVGKIRLIDNIKLK